MIDGGRFLVACGALTGCFVYVLALRQGESKRFSAGAAILSAILWPMAVLGLVVGALAGKSNEGGSDA